MPAFYDKGNTPANKWPAEQEALLRKHYTTMPILDLVALLGKSKSAIYGKAFNIGITREDAPKPRADQAFTIGAPRMHRAKQGAKVPRPAAATPVLNSTVNHKKHPYDGAELRFHAARPGALDAYLLPSRIGDRRTYRAEARNA